MTSGAPFPHNLTEIDPLTRPDHTFLQESDDCYFLGEYTAREGFAYSATNNLVYNLKKRPDRRGKPEWKYKERDIRTAGAALRKAINEEWLSTGTFVPIPPSKAKGDPLHDDRMTRILKAVNPESPIDVRELILQTESTEAAHSSDESRDPARIRQLYKIDTNLAAPPPRLIALCDDVLTTGAHFKASQAVVTEAFSDAYICGIFIARRVPQSIDIEELFGDIDS